MSSSESFPGSERPRLVSSVAPTGHAMISNYLLNYFPKLDIERRNCHGFTAMMKAAMQGRSECVRALTMAGGDVEARDYGRQQRPREWALFTGRYETAFLMERLMAQPCAEQFCTNFSLEWPMLKVFLRTIRAVVRMNGKRRKTERC
ncbi:hypothetical protein CRUP_012269 [Coryphaenoides rupestris]|nr:hypothetical protein CRUP_012269 [Coryphaenoides rupestris]